MENKDLSNKIFSGMKWKAFERLFLQLVNAVSPMVLARILAPEEFGTVAILTVFISLANTFVNNGLCNSIIQKKNSDNTDCSTVFYTQFAIAVICYIILYAASPVISDFYKDPYLTPLLRTMSLSIVIGSIGTMQTTIMKKRMEFSKSFIINGSATLAYGIVGIVLAYNGYGCWSLVYATLAQKSCLVIAAILTVRWHPNFVFSFARLKSLFSYSYKLFIGWLIGTLHQDVYTLVIGKRFSDATLGYYDRAGTFPKIVTKTVTEVVDGVMFPAMSQIQDERERLKITARNLMTMNSYILFPVFLGIAAVGDNLISLILTDKWLPAVPMMQIMCVTYSLNTLNNSNMQVFNSIGRSDIFMKFELIKRSISIVLLFAMSYVSIYAVILVLMLMAVLSNIMNAYQNNKVLGYTYKQILADVAPSFVFSVIMAAGAYFVGFVGLPRIWSLALQICTGVAIYLILSVIFRPKAYNTILSIVSSKLKGKKK